MSKQRCPEKLKVEAAEQVATNALLNRTRKLHTSFNRRLDL